ncbi:MAG: cobb/cobq domain protein glutamine amidotransferase [Acidimicrobiaceae bacterium]|nr:cobb/cobq domain protein glutamine amidotransferase [Acidimicrobiaceae bacterium]
MLKIALVYPELLGTYGDGGNGLVLAERVRRRGIAVELETVGINDQMPAASLYLLGGGEDGPQRLGADLLGRSSFASRVGDGSYVFAVCAGLQLLGTTFAVEGDDEYEGLGLVDARTSRGLRRSVGELVVRVDGRPLVGFENHGGVTTLGESLVPLGAVERGVGNDGVVDGFRTATIWASYAHGPLLAMNPWFADQILTTVLGEELEPLATVADRLYDERVATLT